MTELSQLSQHITGATRLRLKRQVVNLCSLRTEDKKIQYDSIMLPSSSGIYSIFRTSRAPCFLFPEWCFSFPWGHFSRIGFFCPRGVFLFRSVFLVPRNLFFCPWNRFECYWNRFFGSPWYFRCPEGFFLCPTEMKCPRVFLVPVSFGNIDFVAWFNEKRFTKQRYGRC